MEGFEIPTLNSDLTNEKGALQYPCIELLEQSEALALVLTALEPGDLPVIFESNGQLRELVSVRRTPKVIHLLSKVGNLVYWKSSSEKVKIDSVDSAWEVCM